MVTQSSACDCFDDALASHKRMDRVRRRAMTIGARMRKRPVRVARTNAGDPGREIDEISPKQKARSLDRAFRNSI